MRDIINISLSHKLARMVKHEVKTGNYVTTSEFFRDLLRMWQEEKLLTELRASQQEILVGKGRELQQLDDLD